MAEQPGQISLSLHPSVERLHGDQRGTQAAIIWVRVASKYLMFLPRSHKTITYHFCNCPAYQCDRCSQETSPVAEIAIEHDETQAGSRDPCSLTCPHNLAYQQICFRNLVSKHFLATRKKSNICLLYLAANELVVNRHMIVLSDWGVHGLLYYITKHWHWHAPDNALQESQLACADDGSDSDDSKEGYELDHIWEAVSGQFCLTVSNLKHLPNKLHSTIIHAGTKV